MFRFNKSTETSPTVWGQEPHWSAYWPWAIVAIAMLSTLYAVYVLSPVQIPVIIYKVHLVCLGTLIGYVANEMFLKIKDELPQVLIILACIHGLTSGL